jgi:glycosidase
MVIQDQKYSDYIFYNDSLNKDPESIIFNLKGLESYNGDYVEITTVNLYNEEVNGYMKNLYAYWVDPNQDGNFEDGVDGFRLDHMMDDLDNKKLLPDLFEGFWKPLITSARAVNPNIKFIAEQADWGDPGTNYFSKADIDIVYAFWLTRPIGNGNSFVNTLDTLLKLTPQNKYQFLFLENHDLPRYANYMDFLQLGNEGAKASAVAVLLNKGVPFIYYGQELGMKGDRMHGMNDGNDIPKREAFEWSKSIDAPGTALWYKDSGPWWDSTNVKSNDGISVEEQQSDPNSLLNFYKKLLALRKEHNGLSIGEEKIMRNKNHNIVTYTRWINDSKLLIVVNLSQKSEATEIEGAALPFETSSGSWSQLFGDGKSSITQSAGTINLTLEPLGYLVVGLNE